MRGVCPEIGKVSKYAKRVMFSPSTKLPGSMRQTSAQIHKMHILLAQSGLPGCSFPPQCCLSRSSFVFSATSSWSWLSFILSCCVLNGLPSSHSHEIIYMWYDARKLCDQLFWLFQQTCDTNSLVPDIWFVFHICIHTIRKAYITCWFFWVYICWWLLAFG